MNAEVTEKQCWAIL